MSTCLRVLRTSNVVKSVTASPLRLDGVAVGWGKLLNERLGFVDEATRDGGTPTMTLGLAFSTVRSVVLPKCARASTRTPDRPVRCTLTPPPTSPTNTDWSNVWRTLTVSLSFIEETPEIRNE